MATTAAPAHWPAVAPGLARRANARGGGRGLAGPGSCLGKGGAAPAGPLGLPPAGSPGASAGRAAAGRSRSRSRSRARPAGKAWAPLLSVSGGRGASVRPSPARPPRPVPGRRGRRRHFPSGAPWGSRGGVSEGGAKEGGLATPGRRGCPNTRKRRARGGGSGGLRARPGWAHKGGPKEAQVKRFHVVPRKAREPPSHPRFFLLRLTEFPGWGMGASMEPPQIPRNGQGGRGRGPRRSC